MESEESRVDTAGEFGRHFQRLRNTYLLSQSKTESLLCERTGRDRKVTSGAED